MPARIKLQTVNVVEVRNSVVDSIRSYKDTPQGNKRAEAEFERQVRARPNGELFTPEEMEVMLDNGYYDDEPNHQIFLTHSV